jgi:hypothetical protein
MKLRFLLFIFVGLLAVPNLTARDKSDVIVMKNGDKITCEVKGLSSNTLYISVDYILNTLSVDWTKVDHIESKQMFLVKTQDGAVYRGTLSTPNAPEERPKEIEIVQSTDKAAKLERDRVVIIDETSSNLWQRMNGQVGLGFNYTKGNETSQYALNSQVGYVEERWSAGAAYNSSLSSSAGTNVSTRNELSLQARKLMRWNNWYYIGVTDFLQSSVQGIQLQESFGGGVGRNLINRGSTYLTAYGGFAWQQINYQQAIVPARTQQVTTGLLGTQLRLFRFSRATLSVNATLLPALTDPGRVQFNLNTSYYVKLWGQLNWNCTFYGNWDNRPPPGFVGSDYGASSGLSISFGNQQPVP